MADADDPNRPDQTVADYVGIAVGPALIMCLVGSLIFFLLAISYTGSFTERMHWIFFWYVFGIVLTCRISMLPFIAERSWMYGCALTALVWLALQGFVQYPNPSLARDLSPVINLGLLALAWWSSNKLVWDCTNVDEDVDMNAEGLLQATGAESAGKEPADPTPKPGEEKTTATGFTAWWERYQRYRARQEKKRTLGVWVVYYSLAALPLFGLGQTLIPPGDTTRRRWAFIYLTVYVASGLGLLMTTCFLGLRRYLRQRRLKMPAAMTAAWLTFGTVLIVALMGASLLLPRPRAEFPTLNLQALTSPEKQASKHALKGDSPGKGDGNKGGPSEKSDPDSKATGDQGEKGKGPGNEKGDGSGNQKGDSGSSGKDKSKDAKGSSQDDKQKGEDGGKDKQGQSGRQERSAKGQQDKSGGSSQGSRDGGQKSGDEADQARRGRAEAARSMIPQIGWLLKWVVFAVAAVVAVGVVGFAVLRFLANFTGWAARFLDAWRRFWANLFGRRRRVREEAAGPAQEARRAPPRPFGAFRNPFRPRQPWTPYELACYTFAAFEARARELGVARQPGETPLEHAERFGAEYPAMAADARRLALIYARGLYGPAELPPAVNDVLRQVWDCLESGTGQPATV
jgi:hypothetical protein